MHLYLLCFGTLLYALQISGLNQGNSCDFPCRLKRLMLLGPQEFFKLQRHDAVTFEVLKTLCVREITRKMNKEHKQPNIKINVGHQGITNVNNVTNVINVPKAPGFPPITLVIVNNINQTFKGLPPLDVKTAAKTYSINTEVVNTEYKNLDKLLKKAADNSVNEVEGKNDRLIGDLDDKFMRSRTMRKEQDMPPKEESLVVQCVKEKLKDLE